MTERGAIDDPRKQLWRDFRDYLTFERDEGRTRITVTQSTRKNIAEWISPSRQPAQQTRTATPYPASRRPAPSPSASAAAPATPMAAQATPAAARKPYTANTSTAATPASSTPELDAIAQKIAVCTLCPLCKTRHRTVPGHGSPHPDLLFVGEAPGEQEDRQGLPFVGRSGALLTRMLNNLGLSREEVFIANILKCRPPDNRTPTPKERETCLPYLEAQIEQLRPKVIVTLGSTALRGLLGGDKEISSSRGVWHSYRGIALMPTYHPSYLLRNLKARFTTWDDMLKVLERIGRHPPKNTGN